MSPSCLVARLGGLCASCRAGGKVGVERPTRAGGLRRVCGGKQKNGKMGCPRPGQTRLSTPLLQTGSSTRFCTEYRTHTLTHLSQEGHTCRPQSEHIRSTFGATIGSHSEHAKNGTLLFHALEEGLGTFNLESRRCYQMLVITMIRMSSDCSSECAPNVL